MSHFTFAMRLAVEDVAWILYKAADRINNRLVSLTMGKFASRGKECFKYRLFVAQVLTAEASVAQFEELFIQKLAIDRAKALLGRNLSTMLAYYTPDDLEVAPQALILNILGYVFQPDYVSS